MVQWRQLPSTVAPNEDDLTATAEGAMGIALALAARHWKWRVLRRLCSRLAEGADWLMVDASNAQIPFEVGGTDEGDLDALLRRKSVQARESPFARRGRAAAGVVRFVDARAVLWRSNDEPR